MNKILINLLKILIAASQCRNIYFKLKDEVFVGSSPYSVEKLEQLLKDYLGSEKRINDITKPR